MIFARTRLPKSLVEPHNVDSLMEETVK
jgi:hypothetical protein